MIRSAHKRGLNGARLAEASANARHAQSEDKKQVFHRRGKPDSNSQRSRRRMKMYAWSNAGDGEDPELAQRTHREGVKSENRPRRGSRPQQSLPAMGALKKPVNAVRNKRCTGRG